MFVPTPMVVDRQAQQSRGYVLGLILLIMFLSSQDFAPPSKRRAEAAQDARDGVTKHREDIKEKVRDNPTPTPPPPPQASLFSSTTKTNLNPTNSAQPTKQPPPRFLDGRE